MIIIKNKKRMTQARHAERMVKKRYLCGTSVVKLEYKFHSGLRSD